LRSSLQQVITLNQLKQENGKKKQKKKKTKQNEWTRTNSDPFKSHVTIEGNKQKDQTKPFHLSKKFENFFL
jgi:hypothetical protein